MCLKGKMKIQLKIHTSLDRLVRVLISPIDLFTDTSAILNLLDLIITMGCPGGTRSVSRAFRAKRELQCIFLRKKAIVITSKHGTTIFFSY